MQIFFDLFLPRYNSPTNVVWLEQPLYKVFKSKTPPERTHFFAKNLSIFLLFRMLVIDFFFFFGVCNAIVLQLLGLGLNKSIYRLNRSHEIITQINLIN